MIWLRLRVSELICRLLRRLRRGLVVFILNLAEGNLGSHPGTGGKVEAVRSPGRACTQTEDPLRFGMKGKPGGHVPKEARLNVIKIVGVTGNNCGRCVGAGKGPLNLPNVVNGTGEE